MPIAQIKSPDSYTTLPSGLLVYDFPTGNLEGPAAPRGAKGRERSDPKDSIIIQEGRTFAALRGTRRARAALTLAVSATLILPETCPHLVVGRPGPRAFQMGVYLVLLEVGDVSRGGRRRKSPGPRPGGGGFEICFIVCFPAIFGYRDPSGRGGGILPILVWWVSNRPSYHICKRVWTPSDPIQRFA